MKRLTLLAVIAALFVSAVLPAQAQSPNYSKITYIHSDADGSPFAATDEQGNLEWHIDHYPYGDEYRNTEVARKSNLSFAGKAYDEEIGLSYFGGRWHDPAAGRFMSIDPAPVDPEDYRTFNRYAYGFNNPYKYVDPDGNFPIDYAIDGVSISISAAMFAQERSFANGLGLAADIILGVVPYVPAGIGILRFGDDAARAVTSVDPNTIRFSQSSVNGAAELVESMTKNGFKGDAIDVVRMGDGGLTTLDNTRVLAASRANVQVNARIHDAADAIPASISGRFADRAGNTPETFGQAALNRIGRQNESFRRNNPLGSQITGSAD